jgi:multidrug efflux pump subunit AcrB
MFWGGLLVFGILALFLRMKLAMWVMMGLPVSFLGAIMFLPMSWVDVTINVGSLFAFIMVLGVVVDDAIVIGESIHTEIEEKGQTLENVIRGAQKVAMPATFGVLTTVAAFFPMVLESGPTAAFPNAIGFVVVFCLLFSLIESKLILPAHLAHMKPLPAQTRNPFTRLQREVDAKLQRLIQNVYLPLLAWSLKQRYTIFAIFTGIIFITGGMFAGGFISFVGTPKVPHDFSTIRVQMNASTPEQATLDAALRLEEMVRRVDAETREEHGQAMVDGIFVSLRGRTEAEVQVKLVDPEVRPFDTFALSARWREAMPQISGLKDLTIVDDVFGGGTNDGDVSFRINGTDETQLKQAAAEIKQALGELAGVYEISDSEQQSALEARFQLKPLAHSLGLTTGEVARQASYGLYGLEAQRIVRDSEEIRVMVRYPEQERDSLGTISDLLITTPDGSKVPLMEVADITLVDGTNEIYREDGNRTITIWASLDYEVTQPLAVADALKETTFPEIRRKYPRVNVEEAGSLKEERENLFEQIRNLALILLPIYVLLALPLRSYTQPLMIMSVIPFGVIGAIWGHIVLRLDLSTLSIFGIFAAIGVVVNDSLVMVDYVNKARQRGESLIDAVIHGGHKRFRAIILTSLTTFIGLVPIMTETSLQAQMVIPMAVSLAFGVLCATFVTLLLVPCLYLILDDVKSVFGKLRPKPKTPSEIAVET